ncbi:unnamed protein product [Vicia faba]|uniref:EF-hand domain-containing protein n=1 Tax=Vicia faba TaxID=3906 RepID=A0AAV1A2G8_VICFA|nr:unnamed protein product [Vicia faba]
MVRASANSVNPHVHSGVRIVVAGDQGTGKSSLISTAASENFRPNVAPVLPPSTLALDLYPDHVPITVIDTTSSIPDIDRLSTFWLPHLRNLEVRVPVIVVGCKLDLRDETSRQIQVPEVFYYAQKAVLHPTAPLFDQETQTLKPRCVRALKRIFILCDHDRDGALSDAELNDFQVKCFNAPLQPSEIIGVKKKKGLADDLFPPLKYTPDQSVELTNEAIEFLKTIFDAFDADFDGMLRPCELEELFSTAPESPWIGNPYEDAAERNAFQGLSLDAFLSEWALMALLNPTFSVENLIYLGYSGDPLSAVRVTRKRRTDRKRQLSERNVLQCFVFGPRNAGKSALLNSFIGRPYSEAYNPTIEDRYAVNVVDIAKENKKYLVLKEIPESGVEKLLLANKESLASCDIAVFVHDRSVESSWRASSELLVNIAGHGENTGFEVPCLIVAAKDDLESFTSAIQDSIRLERHASG